MEGGTRVWSGIRGGLRNATRVVAPSLSIESHWQILGDHYGHRIEIDPDGIVRESLSNIFVAERDAGLPPGKQLVTEFLPGNFRTGREPLPETTSVLATRDRFSAFIEPLRITMARMRFLELRPAAMRSFADKPPNGAIPALASDGSNLSAVLWSICQDSDKHAEFVDWLSELGEAEILALRFEETSDEQVLLKVEESNGLVTSARSLSDGTLRFLALLTALHSAHIGDTLLLEDADHGLLPPDCACC